MQNSVQNSVKYLSALKNIALNTAIISCFAVSAAYATDPAPAAPVAPTAPVVATDPVVAPAPVAKGLTRAVTVVEEDGAHQYLGTQFGQTLYTFDFDKNGVSACTAKCAEQWPPLLVSAGDAAKLVAPLAAITRANGLSQVTYNGSPIYTYFLDHTEGDDQGDGVGNVWHDIDFVE